MPKAPLARRSRKRRLGPSRHRLVAYLSSDETKVVRDAAELAGMSISAFASVVVVREARDFVERNRHAATRSAGPQKADLFLQLRGAGKHVFDALGGGEAFLKGERAAWSRSGQ